MIVPAISRLVERFDLPFATRRHAVDTMCKLARSTRVRLGDQAPRIVHSLSRTLADGIVPGSVSTLPSHLMHSFAAAGDVAPSDAAQLKSQLPLYTTTLSSSVFLSNALSTGASLLAQAGVGSLLQDELRRGGQ